MRLQLAAPALLALAACSPTVDFHAQEVCATIPRQVFPAAQPGPAPGAPDTLPSQTVTFDLGSGIPDLRGKGVKDVKVLFRELRLTSSTGGAAGPPTEFIQTLRVDLQPPVGSTLAVKRILDYARPAGAAPTSLVVPGDGTNLADYLESGRLTATVQGRGDPNKLPRTSWNADATVCSEVEFTVDYLEAL